MLDDQTIKVGNTTMSKPFVEKPICGEDHNVFVYYNKAQGGGVRRLFRKIHNKSSDFVPEDIPIRGDGNTSYIYEQFMDVDNAEDVKVYTLGKDYAHAETRKSPVVDGVVRRTPDGKEIRIITPLSAEERAIAAKVCEVFGQKICGFDILRANGKSYVIDVNGWSFVKGNLDYYDKCSTAIREMFLEHARNDVSIASTFRKYFSNSKQISLENTWKLKGFFSVMRHAGKVYLDKKTVLPSRKLNLILLQKYSLTWFVKAKKKLL